ncbi:MAG: GNAT family N-acetyltransferase [Bauldia sp.]|nr:GNAT family N-acetyltransferase [Bauldia sp.]
MKWFRRQVRTHIDEAMADDSRALADIHGHSFERGWSAEEMRAMIAAHPVVHVLALRRSEGGKATIAGFVIVRSAAGEAEILTLAVDPQYRRSGYGRLLMEEALRHAYRERAEAVFLEVDETNRAAVPLYAALGFETVGRRARYYERQDGPAGSALVMKLRLG